MRVGCTKNLGPCMACNERKAVVLELCDRCYRRLKTHGNVDYVRNKNRPCVCCGDPAKRGAFCCPCKHYWDAYKDSFVNREAYIAHRSKIKAFKRIKNAQALLDWENRPQRTLEDLIAQKILAEHPY